MTINENDDWQAPATLEENTMDWQPYFRAGELTLDDGTIWGTAMYLSTDGSQVVFRKHPRNVGITPGHNPSYRDKEAIFTEASRFRAQEPADAGAGS